ncbi:MerR family transcriptional regulator, partial [Oceanithermus sp.]
KTRLYSERDIEHLREIRRLTQELGVNLAGVEEIMRLRQELEALQERFEAEIGRLRLELLAKVGEAQGPEGGAAAEAEGEGA